MNDFRSSDRALPLPAAARPDPRSFRMRECCFHPPKLGPTMRRVGPMNRTVLSTRLRELKGLARDAAIPVLKEGFVGIYRWHAKRTLRTVSTVRVVEVDREIVGFALLERLSPEAGYVYYVAVSRAARRQGVGGRLLDDAIRRFRSQGVQVVYAAVERGNRASRGLLRSRGFRSVARKELHHREGGLGAWGLRSRMWIVSGEALFGLRIAPFSSARASPRPRKIRHRESTGSRPRPP